FHSPFATRYSPHTLDLSSFVFSPRNCGACSRERLPHHIQTTSLELIGCCRPQPPYKRRRQCKRVSERSNCGVKFHLIERATGARASSPALVFTGKEREGRPRSGRATQLNLAAPIPHFGAPLCPTEVVRKFRQGDRDWRQTRRSLNAGCQLRGSFFCRHREP